jgi:hypothetical protein
VWCNTPSSTPTNLSNWIRRLAWRVTDSKCCEIALLQAYPHNCWKHSCRAAHVQQVRGSQHLPVHARTIPAPSSTLHPNKAAARLYNQLLLELHSSKAKKAPPDVNNFAKCVDCIHREGDSPSYSPEPWKVVSHALGLHTKVLHMQWG